MGFFDFWRRRSTNDSGPSNSNSSAAQSSPPNKLHKHNTTRKPANAPIKSTSYRTSKAASSAPRNPTHGRKLQKGYSYPYTPGPYIAGQAAGAALEFCAVCVEERNTDSRFVTCGVACTERLAISGPSDKSKCTYCHRSPKTPGFPQCSRACGRKAMIACLFCKTRPKLDTHHLCGGTCKFIATKLSPIILEVPENHVIFQLVKRKFVASWQYPGAEVPTIKNVYKIFETQSFVEAYDLYKEAHGDQEVYRYHGTSKKCTLGVGDNKSLCKDSECALCSILRSSFKVSLANPSGAFGAGIYSSSASNKDVVFSLSPESPVLTWYVSRAYSYTGSGTGAMIVAKVVIGKQYNVTHWNEVKACPSGYDSVVFDRMKGSLNETIVYTDDAIRPVYVVIFSQPK